MHSNDQQDRCNNLKLFRFFIYGKVIKRTYQVLHYIITIARCNNYIRFGEIILILKINKTDIIWVLVSGYCEHYTEIWFNLVRKIQIKMKPSLGIPE